MLYAIRLVMAKIIICFNPAVILFSVIFPIINPLATASIRIMWYRYVLAVWGLMVFMSMLPISDEIS